MSMKESPVEEYLHNCVKAEDGECYKLTSPKGIEDRLVLLPFGYIEFIETKRPVGGVHAPLQIFRAERHRALGQKSRKISNKGEVDQLMQDWRNFVRSKQHE